MNELIMPHNAGVKRVLEGMKEVLDVLNDALFYFPFINQFRIFYVDKVKQILMFHCVVLNESLRNNDLRVADFRNCLFLHLFAHSLVFANQFGQSSF